MKSRVLLHLSCSVLMVLALLAAGSIAHGQDGSQCDFDDQVLKGPAPVPPPAQARPPYFIWKALGRGDQRTAAACPRCLLQHSGLVSWIGQRRIDDERFAQSTFNAMFPGNYNNPYFPIVFVFGECYGGGMIDDLAVTLTLNPMSIVSASFFNQTASYPVDPANGGNGTDFIWAYVRAFQQPALTAQLAAAIAGNDDPFGWSPRPNPPRTNKETLGSETPEYYSQNQGDNILLAATGFDRIILWAGQPNEVDDKQLNQLLLQLLAAPVGFDKKNIVVLFASGRPANAALVQTMQKLYGNDQTHLRQANQKQLDIALKWAFPADAPKSQFFFFLAADHGCNNAFQAQPKTGNGGMPIEDGGDWGNGDDDYPPS
jgi:hypothetical protein